MEDIATVISDKYRTLSRVLNETIIRLWAAVEARRLGDGREHMNRDDPMSPLRWTSKSTSLAEELKWKGHIVSHFKH